MMTLLLLILEFLTKVASPAISLATFVRGWFKDRRKDRLEAGKEDPGIRQTLRHATLPDGMNHSEVFNFTGDYIPPHFCEVFPDDTVDKNGLPVGVRHHEHTALEYLQGFVRNQPLTPHCLVVTGTAGLGKTALLYEFIIQNEHAVQPHDILYVRLSDAAEEVSARLKTCPPAARGNTVVLFDALEEDPAIPSARWPERLTQLVKDCVGLRKIIVAARPECYAKVRDELYRLLARRFPNDALSGRKPVQHIALLGLSRVQIQHCLSREGKLCRQFAEEFHALVPGLAHHPLGFTVLLGQARAAEAAQTHRTPPPTAAPAGCNLWHLYREIVQRWMERERDKASSPELRRAVDEISKQLALMLHVDQPSAPEPFLTDAQLDESLRQLGVATDPDNKLDVMERTLLRRAGGRWSFAHPEIGEYLFVQQFLRAGHAARPPLVAWKPLTKQFALGHLRHTGTRDFTRSNFSGLNLAGLDLAGRDFREADLTGCNLRGVNCQEADLRGAHLEGANFTGARTAGAQFDPAAWESVPGLRVTPSRARRWLGQAAEGTAEWAGECMEKLREAGESVSSFANPRGIFSNDIGIDLGPTDTLVYVRDHGIVLREPSVVAVKAGTNLVLAVGNEAKRMLGRGLANIVAVRPLKDGFIANYDLLEAMLRHFITKVHNRRKMVRPRVVIAVPSSMTEVERRAVKKCATYAGAREVQLIEESMAAAIGVGLPVQDAAGNMIINLGINTTEVALIALSGIVFSRSVRVALNDLDEAICDHIMRAHHLVIGPLTTAEIRLRIGSAFPPATPGEEATMEIKGRDRGDVQPRTITITSQEVREALAEPINTIVESIRITLERCPPELAADLVDRGLVLAGGGALLRGLDELLKKETGLPVHVAEDPLSAVAEGLGKVLSESKFLRQVASSDRAWR